MRKRLAKKVLRSMKHYGLYVLPEMRRIRRRRDGVRALRGRLGSLLVARSFKAFRMRELRRKILSRPITITA